MLSRKVGGKEVMFAMRDSVGCTHTDALDNYRFVGLIAGDSYQVTVELLPEQGNRRAEFQSNVSKVTSDVASVQEFQIVADELTVGPVDEAKGAPVEWQVDRWLRDAGPIAPANVSGRVVALPLFQPQASKLGSDATLLNELNRQLGPSSTWVDSDAVVMGVVVEDSTQDNNLTAVMDRYQLNYPIAVDTKEQITATRFDRRGSSNVIVISKDGQSFEYCRTPMEVILNVRNALLE